MQRAAWWGVWIVACTPFVAGCGCDDSRAGTSPERDSTHVQSLSETQRAPLAHDYYAALQRAVTTYERLAAQGGWPVLPDSAHLRMGDRGRSVAVLERRLAASGDLQLSPLDRIGWRPSHKRFDDRTEAALRRFQSRHGLEPDGVLGPWTRVALNVPAAERAQQLRANLARVQRTPQWGRGRVIVVNIPEYRLRGYEDGHQVLEMRVIVGTADDPTPSFSDRMTYVVFRPYWNVPASIALEDLLPEIRRDPSVLERKHLEVVVATARESVLADSVAVDWSQFETSGYALRRRPGRRNPLGDVKFMFPNEHSVYLHDTPSDGYFRWKRRMFSHGCVRVEQPVDLAEFVLHDLAGWDREKIGHAMWVDETQTVRLPQPIPTHIVYWTAWVDDAGRVQFRDDIYKLDAAAETRAAAALP